MSCDWCLSGLSCRKCGEIYYPTRLKNDAEAGRSWKLRAEAAEAKLKVAMDALLQIWDTRNAIYSDSAIDAALSSTSAGAGLLKRLEAAEAVAEAARKYVAEWKPGVGRALTDAIEALEAREGGDVIIKSAECSGRLTIYWDGKGFGTVTLRVTADGTVHIDSECMDRPFLKDLFSHVIDNAKLDGEP